MTTESASLTIEELENIFIAARSRFDHPNSIRLLYLAEAAARQSLEAGEWKPIDTAPKDSPLLLYRDGPYGYTRIGFYAEGGGMKWADPWSGRFREPTHWQPLPPPPAASAPASATCIVCCGDGDEPHMNASRPCSNCGGIGVEKKAVAKVLRLFWNEMSQCADPEAQRQLAVWLDGFSKLHGIKWDKPAPPAQSAAPASGMLTAGFHDLPWKDAPPAQSEPVCHCPPIFDETRHTRKFCPVHGEAAQSEPPLAEEGWQEATPSHNHGDFGAAAQSEPVSVGINFDVIKRAYGWTIDVHGEVCGLVAGDMGYDGTGIKIPLEHLEAWHAKPTPDKPRWQQCMCEWGPNPDWHDLPDCPKQPTPDKPQETILEMADRIRRECGIPDKPHGQVYDKTEEHDLSGKMPPILFQDGRFVSSADKPQDRELIKGSVGKEFPCCEPDKPQNLKERLNQSACFTFPVVQEALARIEALESEMRDAHVAWDVKKKIEALEAERDAAQARNLKLVRMTNALNDDKAEMQATIATLQKAVEFGGYLATATQLLIQRVNDEAEAEHETGDDLVDASRRAWNSVYEFNKRVSRLSLVKG